MQFKRERIRIQPGYQSGADIAVQKTAFALISGFLAQLSSDMVEPPSGNDGAGAVNQITIFNQNHIHIL